MNSLLATTTHFEGTHFFSGSSILFLVFSPVFSDNTTLYTIPLKKRGVLMQKSFCGRLPEEECVGKEILDPLAVFFVVEYSMYAVEVSFVLPKRPAISGQQSDLLNDQPRERTCQP